MAVRLPIDAVIVVVTVDVGVGCSDNVEVNDDERVNVAERVAVGGGVIVGVTEGEGFENVMLMVADGVAVGGGVMVGVTDGLSLFVIGWVFVVESDPEMVPDGVVVTLMVSVGLVGVTRAENVALVVSVWVRDTVGDSDVDTETVIDTLVLIETEYVVESVSEVVRVDE